MLSLNTYEYVYTVYKRIALFHSQFGIRLPVAGELGETENIADGVFFVSVVPPKVNVLNPKNGGLEDVFPFPMGDFQVPC